MSAAASTRALLARYRRDALGVVLFALVEDYESRFLAAYRELGFADVRRSHGAVLRYLEAAGASISRISERAGISKQTVGNIVRQLEQLGYLTVTVDPGDRRARRVRFTARGERLLAVSQQVVDDIRGAYRARMGQRNFDALADCLPFVAERLAAQAALPTAGEPRRFLHFGRLLVDIAEHFEQSLRARLSARDNALISRPLMAQLYAMSDDGLSVSELAASQRVTVQAVSLNVRQMVRQGILDARECSGDSRAKRLRLTAAGRQLLSQLNAACAGVKAAYREQLGAKQLASLERLLGELHRAL